MKKSKTKKKASRKTNISKGVKTIQLTMDRGLKDLLDIIAHGAGTDISTTVNVLLVTGMHMGRGGQQKALDDAAATNMELSAKLLRCRQVMEANDPGNALDIFGPPSIPPKGDEPPPDAASVAPSAGSAPTP